MKPQKQLFRHRPADGIFGDCHRTAIAIVLDLDAADVPHFMDQSDGKNANDAHDRVEAWLNERGIATINILFPGEVPLDEVLSTVAACNPRGRPAFILGGKSRNGVNHSVVCCDGEIVCDPSQDDSGIVGPCHDGFYWLTFFGHLDATADPSRRNSSPVVAREKLESAALALSQILTVRGASCEGFSIAIGDRELHAYAPCPELLWQFPKPSKVNGYQVEWHWGNVSALKETAA
ncbi:MAG: hypothetical protein PS018_17245 [bacterium]|nr:hypothetical protein [bacterium]